MFSETNNISKPAAISSRLQLEAQEQQDKEKRDGTERTIMDSRNITVSSDIAIRVHNLSKCYQIYDKPQDRLKQSLYPRVQRLIGCHPKQYCREFWAIKNVSFEIKKGQTVGIVGKNGSGKSTLLQLITGTLASTTGTVEINGRLAALLELGSGFNTDFTGRENIYLNGAILGLSEDEINDKLGDILAFADIGEFIDQPVKTYSSGMFVRLAFSIQANTNPDILIIDEALAVGDAYFVHRCMLRFRELQEQGKTILFVSHDANSIKNLCERAIWLENGLIKMTGNSSSVVDRYLAYLFGRTTVSSGKNDGMLAGLYPIVNSNKQKLIETTIPNIDRRLGNQACNIVGVGLYDDVMQPIVAICNDSIVTLRLTIRNKALKENTPLAIGYIFRNGKGQEIASTNSIIEGFKIASCTAGNFITVAMQITLPRLHPGSYAFSPTAGYLNSKGEIELGDRIENAIVFQITSNVEINVLMNFQTLMTMER